MTTTYYVNNIPTRRGALPVNDAADAEYLSREDDLYVFAVAQ